METRRNAFKAQSAMEYLMTYGWAILIIAVVLIALFSLNVFNPSLGNVCLGGPGYTCSGMSLGTTGNMLFTFGQGTGSTYYNVGMGCAAASTSAGLPSNTLAMVYLSAAGAATAVPANGAAAGALSITTGQTVSVTGLTCYATNGQPVLGSAATVPIGTTFSGSLWINYTLGSGAPSASNPMLTTKFASVTTKVT